MLIKCPHCDSAVLPKSDGTCPHCRRMINVDDAKHVSLPQSNRTGELPTDTDEAIWQQRQKSTKSDYSKQFYVIHRRQNITFFVSVFVILLIVIIDKYITSPGEIGLEMALLPFIAGIFMVLRLWHWRCPSCRRYLGRCLFNPRSCPHCGCLLRS